MLYSTILVSLAIGAAVAQDTSTVTMFIDNDSDRHGTSLAISRTPLLTFIVSEYVGSVIDAESDKATFALECTRGDPSLCMTGESVGYPLDPTSPSQPPKICQKKEKEKAETDHGEKFTLTLGPSTFEVSSSSRVSGTSAIVNETCAVTGTTEAECMATIAFQADGAGGAISATRTFDELPLFQVPMSGMDKLQALETVGGALQYEGHSHAVATQTEEGAAVATRVPVVYKVLVPGAVGFAAAMVL